MSYLDFIVSLMMGICRDSITKRRSVSVVFSSLARTDIRFVVARSTIAGLFLSLLLAGRMTCVMGFSGGSMTELSGPALMFNKMTRFINLRRLFFDKSFLSVVTGMSFATHRAFSDSSGTSKYSEML